MDFTALSISSLKDWLSPFAEISEIVPSGSTVNVKTDDIVALEIGFFRKIRKIHFLLLPAPSYSSILSASTFEANKLRKPSIPPSGKTASLSTLSTSLSTSSVSLYTTSSSVVLGYDDFCPQATPKNKTTAKTDNFKNLII